MSLKNLSIPTRPRGGLRLSLSDAVLELDSKPAGLAYGLGKVLEKASVPALAVVVTHGHPGAWAWLVCVVALARIRPGAWTLWEATEDERAYAAEVGETLLGDDMDLGGGRP